MRENWFVVASPRSGLDINASGIYEWRIVGVGVYVGKARRLASRMQAYPNNVGKILDGRPWRKNKPLFRPVHYALRKAHDESGSVTFSVLETCSLERLNERERHWINVRRREADSGGLPLLNLN